MAAVESRIMRQLDIFADSAPVQRANELIGALANLDHMASRQALLRLAEADPHHSGFSQYLLLCNFVDHWADRNGDADWPYTPEAIAAEEQLLREQIVPAADVMGDAGRDMVRKCWSMLAKASDLVGIASEQCGHFAAELYLRAQQFPDAVRAAQAIPGAEMRAAAQRWLGLGFFGCGKTGQARRAAMRYAWLAPDRFNAFVDETGDTQLARDWGDFQVDLDGLDATWFPAWCEHEGKTGNPILDNLPASDGCVAYRLVSGLSVRERGGLCREVYEDRARLKQLNGSFFDFYMKRRSDLHALKK